MKEIAMIKVVCPNTACKIIDRAIQMQVSSRSNKNITQKSSHIIEKSQIKYREKYYF